MNLGSNTFVPGSNDRNLYIAVVIATSKNALSFLLLFMFSLKKIRDKSRTGSAWKPVGGRGVEEGGR
jgi:hypothetical protein